MRSMSAGPFTTSMAHANGWTDSALHHAVEVDTLDRVRRGVYAEHSPVRDPSRDAAAAALAYPGVPLSHLSSALLRGIPIVGVRVRKPEMTAPPRGPGNIRGVRAHRARVRDHELCVLDGRLCLSAARTVIDLARHYPETTAVVAIDHVLHNELATADEIRDVLDFCRTWPGGPRAVSAARLSDSRSESPLESISRLMIPRLGLAAPEPQVRLFDEFGQLMGRGDFYWDEFGVVGEADGHAKYDDGREVLVKEKDRELELRRTGLEVVRWYWSHAVSQHAFLVHGLRQGFERGIARDRSGLQRRWTAESTPRIAVL